MVCIYCGSDSQVINSRHQKRINQVWRRRKCTACRAVFTTHEAVDTAQALRVRRTTQLEPFSRDKLFISIYECLKHRRDALRDATDLTATILGLLYPLAADGVLEREVVIEVTGEVLARFDTVAATLFTAFHRAGVIKDT